MGRPCILRTSGPVVRRCPYHQQTSTSSILVSPEEARPGPSARTRRPPFVVTDAHHQPDHRVVAGHALADPMGLQILIVDAARGATHERRRPLITSNHRLQILPRTIV